MKAITLDQNIRYICKCDRRLDLEEQTIFDLKPLSARDAARMQDGATETRLGGKDQDSTMIIRSGSQVLEALEKGLKGWENFKDSQGKEIEFRENNGKPRPEMFDYLPPAIRKELAEVIIEGSVLSEEEEKN